MLQESDIFMDALNAATVNKKEVKKRKRRPSTSKEPTTPTETQPPTSSSPPQSPTTHSDQNGTTTSGPASPTSALKSIAPFNFYQDTLNNDDDSKENADEKEESNEEAPNKKLKPDEDTSEDKENSSDGCVTKVIDGLKGVLLHGKKKGPKRSIRWKEDSDLVQVQYFELDETERCNVSRAAFTDMARMELTGEREALQLSRKTPNEDLMDIQVNWSIPMEIELPSTLAEIVVKSLERDIQFAREKNVLPALYYSKRMIPDTPTEPDMEHHPMTDPVIIPLEPTDDGEQEEPKPVIPWPEPKGSPPPPNIPSHPVHPLMNQQGIMGGFPHPNLIAGPQMAGFPQIQNFQNIGPGGPVPHEFPGNMPNQFGNPGNFMPNGMMEWNMNMMNQQQMGDQMIQQPNAANMFGQKVFPGMGAEPNTGFPPHFGNTGGPQHLQNNNMFHQNNQMHNNFGGNRGRGGFRRGGGWVRGNGPGNWNNNRGGSNNSERGGGSHRGMRICKNVKNHGYCRNRDNCAFYHPNV